MYLSSVKSNISLPIYFLDILLTILASIVFIVSCIISLLLLMVSVTIFYIIFVTRNGDQWGTTL